MPNNELRHRDRSVIDFVMRYHLATNDVLGSHMFAGLTANAVAKITAKLCSCNLLARYPLIPPQNYFRLGSHAINLYGMSSRQSEPLGPQALPTDYAAMVYATKGKEHRRRLTLDEIEEYMPWLPGDLAKSPYCIDAQGRLDLVRVDLGGSPQHVARKVAAAAHARLDVPQIADLAARSRFQVVVLTSTEDKSRAINPFRLPCWHQLNDLQKTDILCGAMGLIYGSEYGEGYFSSANASVIYATIREFPHVKNFEELRDRLTYVVGSSKRFGLDDKSRDAGNHVKMSVTRLASVAALNITEDNKPNEAAFKYRIDPTRLFEQPSALHFSLSATLGPGASQEIARFATFMLLIAGTFTTRRCPVYLVIDEFQRMATSNLDYLLQLARSLGVSVVLANQSMEDLRRAHLIPTLETNCRYRQWFAISGWDDQERLSKASGETIDSKGSITVSRSTGERGTTTSTSRTSQEFIAPRLTQNEIKLVSDDDRKSVVLINRGDGYAQYGGMPIVVESDFHITFDEYQKRRNAPWPSTIEGTFVPANWVRPPQAVPHRGRKPNTTPAISLETITIQPAKAQAIAPEPNQTQHFKRGRKGKSRNKQTQPKQVLPARSTAGPEELFARYLRENPLGNAPKTIAKVSK